MSPGASNIARALSLSGPRAEFGVFPASIVQAVLLFQPSNDHDHFR